MVNSINLTMTNKDQIATWKANRRKLVSAHVNCRHYYIHCFTRLIQLSGRRIISPLKSFYRRDMAKNVIGGLLGPSCLSVWLDILHSALKIHMKRIRK